MGKKKRKVKKHSQGTVRARGLDGMSVRWVGDDGEASAEFQIPYMGCLPLDQLLAIDEASGKDGGAQLRAFLGVLSEYVPADVLGSMTANELADFVEQWQAESEKWSKVAPGESSGSPA